jgi:hypothetical protein
MGFVIQINIVACFTFCAKLFFYGKKKEKITHKPSPMHFEMIGLTAFTAMPSAGNFKYESQKDLDLKLKSKKKRFGAIFNYNLFPQT